MAVYCPYIDTKTVYLSCQECKAKICTPSTFFCLVAGSNSFTDYEMLSAKLDHLLQTKQSVVIVTGDGKGTNELARRYGKEHGHPLLIYGAEWVLFGKAAGYIRDEAMHRFIAKQEQRGVVAFWDGESKETQHSFVLAKKYGNEIKVISV